MRNPSCETISLSNHGKASLFTLLYWQYNNEKVSRTDTQIVLTKFDFLECKFTNLVYMKRVSFFLMIKQFAKSYQHFKLTFEEKL